MRDFVLYYREIDFKRENFPMQTDMCNEMF